MPSSLVTNPLTFIGTSESIYFLWASDSKAIETGILLLVDQAAAAIFVKKYKGLVTLANLKDLYQFTKPLQDFEPLTGASQLNQSWTFFKTHTTSFVISRIDDIIPVYITDLTSYGR